MKDREYYEFIEDLNYYRFGLNYASSTLEPEDELMLQIVKAGEISELYKVSNFRKSIQKVYKNGLSIGMLEEIENCLKVLIVLISMHINIL